MDLKWWQSFPLLAVGAYGVFCLAVALRQNRLIYFPQRLTPAEADKAFAFYRVERWPAGSGPDYRGIVKRTVPESSLTNGTILIFHGNGGGAHERESYCDALQMLGWRVILAEYPGYAARSGAWGEASFREDGRATARLVRQTYPGPLVLLGESLGSGVAASVAADTDLKADAVVLGTPWDNLANVGAYHYPWLPVRLLIRDRYDSVAYLQGYQGPVMVLQAEDDEIMPAACTRALYDGLPHADRKRWVSVPYVGHNEWFWQVTDEQWREILGRATSAAR
ncbi:MAG TPA: alpha/beta fold hydrolase [Kiritimatiellia bacterium]|nr:alpha/beta fold hydrolase [Kiritimatiellia bacterium]HPS07693.1 alpha/beta fold hydrolase [Kiritimatiellia bacterium]